MRPYHYVCRDRSWVESKVQQFNWQIKLFCWLNPAFALAPMLSPLRSVLCALFFVLWSGIVVSLGMTTCVREMGVADGGV